MKYNIVINQIGARKISKNLTLEDMAIFDYIYHFCNNGADNITRLTHKGKIYTWINYTHLLNEMPLLRARSKSSITAATKKLQKYGLIVCINKKDDKYIRIGPKANVLFFGKEKTDWSKVEEFARDEYELEVSEFWGEKRLESDLFKEIMKKWKKQQIE